MTRTAGGRALVAALALVLAGCVAGPDPETFPAADDLPDAVAPIGNLEPTVVAPVDTSLRAASLERRAKQMTVRIRTTGCGALGTGSGFAVGDGLIVTNRHVVADATNITLNTWDGGSLDAVVHGVDVTDDLALVRIDRSLPTAGVLATEDPATGADVTVAGYPLGGQLEMTAGKVVDYARLDSADGPRVLRLSAEIWPGSSGGPVLDAQGRIVGVVFAIERLTDYALAVPVSQLRDIVGGDVPTTGALGCAES